jgi:hypothetical protein
MVEVPVPPVIENLKLAFCVFMNQDVRIARTMAAPIVGENSIGIRLAWRSFQAAIRRCASSST